MITNEKKINERRDICDYYNGVAQDLGLAGFDTVSLVEWFLTFQRNTKESRLCVPSKFRERFTQLPSVTSHGT